jgi:hypothetical protein
MRFVLLFLLIVVCSAELQAQNYQCLQPGKKQFFTNDVHYLRGMRIDSVALDGTSTIFYPYHSPRYIGVTQNVNYYGGSWLGKKVVQLANGTTIFDNIWNDTVFVRTQAGLGESWTFFDDASPVYYKATVTKIDTESVLGQLDSVKSIQITALIGSTVQTTNEVNGLTLALSKNHGFVRVFDLYSFPFKVGSRTVNDYFFNIFGRNYLFKQTSYQNPRYYDLFDFAVGDVFQFECKLSSPSYTVWEINTNSQDTIKQVSVGPAGKTYVLKTGVQASTMQAGGRTIPSAAGPYIHTRTFVPDERLQLLDTLRMPEESGNSFIYYYNPADSTMCTVSASYRREHFYLVTSPDSPMNEAVTYKAGFGLIDSANGYMWDYRKQATFIGLMRGTIKNGKTCGEMVPVGVVGVTPAESMFEICPNPANGSLNVRYDAKSGTAQNWEVSIVDMRGLVVYRETANSSILRIKTADLPEGFYLLRLIAGEKVFTEKLNIVH